MAGRAEWAAAAMALGLVAAIAPTPASGSAPPVEEGAQVTAPDVVNVADGVAYDPKFAGANPVAAAQLAYRERVALATGVSPRDQAPPTDDAVKAKLLTILVEFDENARDDFAGVWVPETVYGSRKCILLPQDTPRSGPLHNQIQDPADYDQLDNQTFWRPDFNSQHYDDLLYSKTGVTERVRPDLTGPNGEPGVDISGYTMRKMYKRMSGSSYVIRGEVTPWVEVEHSEAWYGATVCYLDGSGEWVAPGRQSNDGHPDNPLGVDQLMIDAVDQLAETQPDFPFAEYDTEDPGDLDGDGNFYEPDGILDHVALVHAGMDKSAFGSAQGTDGIWSHSNSILGGYEIPGADGIAARPVRLQRRGQRGRGVLGLDGRRLTHRPDLPVDPDLHEPVEPVDSRLGRAQDFPAGGVPGGRRHRPGLLPSGGHGGRRHGEAAAPRT